MRAIELLLLSFDHALQHEWESLAAVLQDVGADEAAWQAPAHAALAHDDGVGKPGTVLWYLNHLEHCHRHYTAVLQGRPVTESPDTRPPGELPWDAVVPALQRANTGLRAEIAKLADTDLDLPCTGKKSVAEFLLGVVRHISWHGGQVATVRRLYRVRQ